MVGWVNVANSAPHRILRASRKLCRFLGFQKEQVLSRSLHIFFGPQTDPFALTKRICEILSTSAESKNLSKVIQNFHLYDSNGFFHLVCCHLENRPDLGILIRFESCSSLCHQAIGVIHPEIRISSSGFHRPESGVTDPEIRISSSQFKRPESDGGICDWHDELLRAIQTLDAVCITDRGQRPEDMVLKSEVQVRAGILVVLTKAPHTILEASPEVCELLGFTASEMAQRSVRVIYGPLSDPTAIPSAVKFMLLAQNELFAAAIPSLTVYDRRGASHAVRATCSRLASRSGDSCAEAFRLRLEWPDADVGAELPAAARRPSLPACLWSMS